MVCLKVAKAFFVKTTFKLLSPSMMSAEPLNTTGMLLRICIVLQEHRIKLLSDTSEMSGQSRSTTHLVHCRCFEIVTDRTVIVICSESICSGMFKFSMGISMSSMGTIMVSFVVLKYCLLSHVRITTPCNSYELPIV